MNQNLRDRLLASTVVAGSLLVGVSAWAQTPPTATPAAAPATTETTADDQTIVVTGTRIARPDLVASSPVAVVSSESIKTSNSVTVEKLLQQNPQFLPAQSSSSNNPGAGVATLDLRALGDKRTLVLVDGKRMVPYDTNGTVDVNTIPTPLIKRIDVLTGGASTTYGSDAVAGVVNFVLDDRFQGYKFDGSNQVTQRGDGQVRDVSLTAGWKLGDRGNLVVSGGYTQRYKVQQKDRGFSSQTLDSSTPGPYHGLAATGSSNGVPTLFDDGIWNGSGIHPSSGYFQVGPGGTLTDAYSFYNYNSPNYFQSPLKRYNITALGRYDVTDNIEFYGRATYVRSKVQLNLAPTATAGFNFDLYPDNPFLSADEKAIFFNPANTFNADGSVSIPIRRRIVETAGRTENFDTKLWQVVGGFRGDFSGNGHWDVSAQYSQNKRHIDLLNDLSYSKLTNAIDATTDGSGNAICRSAAARSAGCVPLNLFTTDPLSADSLNYVLANGAEDDKTTEFVVSANLASDIGFLKSPFADSPAAVAIGAEYRRETGLTRVDSAYGSGDLIYYGQGQDVCSRNAAGDCSGPVKYNVKEAYIEIKMPLVQDKPFIKSLNLEAGFRYSDYSTVGSVYTYKAGGDWSPVDGVRFRGLYQRAVRAPNLNELFAPKVAGTDSLQTDPCAGALDANSALGKLCIATGVPAALIGHVSQPVAAQVNVLIGGNPDLTEEKSDTYTIGVVINPPQFRAFSLSVDYYQIKIANAIDSFGGSPTNIVNGCYNVANNPTLDPSNPFCVAASNRNPATGTYSGPITYGILEQQYNIAAIKTRGLDIVAGYHGDIGSLRYAASIAGTYTIAYDKQPDPSQAVVHCAGRFGASCNLNPIPKWKHRAEFSIGNDQVTFITDWRYIGKVREDVGTDIIKSKIKAFNYFDETINFSFDQKYSLRLGVQNLFDKKPPIVGDTTGDAFAAGSTFPNTYDVLGRTFFVGVSANF